MSNFVAWGLFTAVQLHTPSIAYYEARRQKLVVFCIPALWYIPVFLIAFGALAASIFLFMEQAEGNFLDVYIVFVVMTVLDKVWFVAFDVWKSANAIVLLSAVQLSLSVALCVLMMMHESWVSAGLAIPFFLLMVHLVIFSIDWKLHAD